MPFNQILLGAAGLPIYEYIISSNHGPWSKSSEGSAAPSTSPIILRLIIEPGITISSTTPGTSAVLLNSLHANSIVEIINEGHILGAGGDAGGVNAAGSNGINLTASGVELKLTNASGTIRGGGGAGGSGGGGQTWNSADGIYEPTGGGGGGGGGCGGGQGSGSGTDATVGSAAVPGSGANGTGSGGDGGDGGDYGLAGQAGTNGTKVGGPQNGGVAFSGGGGGSSGNAIKHLGSNTITWISGESNVEGDVGT